MNHELSPRELAQIIGVSESTLKRWVDNGLLSASRTPGGHRRIDRTEAIRFIREQNVRAHRPDLLGFEEAVDLSEKNLARPELPDAMLAALEAGNERSFSALIHGAFLAGYPLGWLFNGPIRRAMHRLGELWEHDEIRGVLIEHRATEICFDAIMRIRFALTPPADDAPAAVGAAAAGDIYRLPTLLAAVILREVGLRETNLGAETPLHVLTTLAQDTAAKVVWLSISTPKGAAAVAEDLPDAAKQIARLGATLIIGGKHSRDLGDVRMPHVMLLDSMSELAAFGRGLMARR